VPNRFKLFAVVAAVMVVSAGCGGGGGDVVEDPAQNIAENIAAAEGLSAADPAALGDPAATAGLASADDIATDMIDNLEGEATPKGGYLAGGFFFPFDVAMLSSSSSPGELSSSSSPGEATPSGYEALTTVTVSQDDDIVFVWQSRGANDGGNRYSCQLSVHEGGVSQLAFEVVANGDEAYYWDPTLAEPELRSNDAPEIDEATWLCPSQPGFFQEVPEFFTLGDVVDSGQDVDVDGSVSGWHYTSRMDALEAGLDANAYEGEVLVTADATRTAADVEVRWPPLTGTLAELTMEEPSS
jgi:hypothetical protein